MDSMNGAIRVLERGDTMSWLDKGTPYQKVIDSNGLTTEFIRCPGPSRVVVARVSRRKVQGGSRSDRHGLYQLGDAIAGPGPA
jgi:hypothetical protein